MSLTDRLLDGLKATIQLNERVATLAQEVAAQAAYLRELDRRLIRVETALELATRGRFAPLPPSDDEPSPGS